MATESNDRKLRLAAIEKLTDKLYLSKLAVGDQVDDIHTLAARRLKDSALAQRAMDSNLEPSPKEPIIRSVIAQAEENGLDDKLNDDSFLAKLAAEAKAKSVRVVALDRIKNPKYLAQLALNCKDSEIRREAVVKLDERAGSDYQHDLVKVAINDNNVDVRVAAVDRLTKNGLLVKLATEDWERKVRKSSVRRLTDQWIVAHIAGHDRDAEVRKEAADRLGELRHKK